MASKNPHQLSLIGAYEKLVNVQLLHQHLSAVVPNVGGPFSWFQ